MNITLDENLLNRAHEVLSTRKSVYWIVGGSCSGKSTVCRLLSTAHQISVYDMDAHMFGEYRERYTPERHPASTAWLEAADPLAWALSLCPTESYLFNRAVSAELLDLLAGDLAGTVTDGRLLVDGGISSPALLARVMPATQIACLEIPLDLSARLWAESEERREMREAIWRLPNPQEAWSDFLSIDAMIHRTIVAECRASRIQVFSRNEATPPEAVAEDIAWYFGF